MKAERLFKEIMRRLIASGTDPDDNKIVEMSLKLARIYSDWQQDDNAILGYKHCISTQERKFRRGVTKTHSASTVLSDEQYRC